MWRWKKDGKSYDCGKVGLCWCDVQCVQVASCGMSSVQNSITHFQRTRISPACPGVINRHFALLSQESDCRPSAFSEALTERLFVAHWVEECPSDDAMFSHQSSFSVLPVVLRFITRFFFLSIRSLQGFCVRCYQFLVLCGQMQRRPTNVFFLSRIVTHSTVDCTFVRADALKTRGLVTGLEYA